MRAPQVKRGGRDRRTGVAARVFWLRLAGLAVLGALTGLAPGLDGQARADGATPGSLGIMLPVDKPREIVLATTFGLIISDDGGSTWLWTCEQVPTSMAGAYAVGPPPTMAGSLGDRFYALSPLPGVGLAFSDDGTCTWHSSGGALAGESVTLKDFFVAPTNPDRVLAIAAVTNDAGDVGPQSVYASSDGGTTFDPTPLFAAPVGAALVGVEIARTDPNIIYLAYYLTLTSGRDPVLVRSSDGGTTWTTVDVQAALGPNQVRIFAVDPADPDLVYLRVIASGSESVAVTRDGGMTFAQPLTIPNGAATAFVRLASGTVLVGARLNFAGDGGGASGAGYRSTDGGKSFVPWTLSPQPHIVGLAERVSGTKSMLYLSGENYVDTWALAVSSDEGQTVTPVMSYDQVRGIKPCAQAICANSCLSVGGQGVWENDVCTGALLDAGTVAPPPPARPGCHCGAVGGEPAGILSILAVALAFAVKLMRRPGPRPVRRGRGLTRG
ncbi:MAG TPA: hypothetical protein VKO16_13625 [Polyangia bacterium]|nr:hypothetical protein [Polyangia bacterium]